MRFQVSTNEAVVIGINKSSCFQPFNYLEYLRVLHADTLTSIFRFIFKKIDPNSSKKGGIDFNDSDDEFKDFEESKKTMKKINDNSKVNKKNPSVITTNSKQEMTLETNNSNQNPNDDDFDWNDL